MSRAKVSTVRSLQLLLSDGATGKYPQAKIFLDDEIIPVTTLNLVDLGDGRYAVDYTFSTIGQYFVKYTVYTDSGHTSLDTTYSIELEDILVESNNLDSLPSSFLGALIDSVYNLKQYLKIIAAAVAGKANSGPSTTNFRDLENTRNVIVTGASPNGDRTIATYDPGT
jgi:hypothetical protein